MSVYTIYADRTKEQETASDEPAPTLLDGDFKSAFPLGYDFHPITKSARLEDGTRIEETAEYQGVPVDMSGLPKTVRFGGHARELVDLQKEAGHFLVSGRMRDVIEALEPGVHQFQPVELIWKDGSHAADFFWFNICNRVDGMDREKTTHPFNERIGIWSFVEGRKYVVSLKQTAGFHAWIDSRLTSGSVFVSEDFKAAMAASEVTGIGFNTFETTCGLDR